MAEDDDEYVLIESPLIGEFRRNGITVDAQIYRGGEEPIWILEVVDAVNNSCFWEEGFITDRAGMEEFLASVKREAVQFLLPEDLH